MPKEHESVTVQPELAESTEKPDNPTKPLPASEELLAPAPRRTRIWALIVLAVVVLLTLGTARACSWLGSDNAPLSQKTVDRSGPVVLKSIQDLSRFEAATGTFQVVVDLEKDTKYVPSAIKGQRTLFVGVGT